LLLFLQKKKNLLFLKKKKQKNFIPCAAPPDRLNTPNQDSPAGGRNAPIMVNLGRWRRARKRTMSVMRNAKLLQRLKPAPIDHILGGTEPSQSISCQPLASITSKVCCRFQPPLDPRSAKCWRNRPLACAVTRVTIILSATGTWRAASLS
jgi:hypothetical protein